MMDDKKEETKEEKKEEEVKQPTKDTGEGSKSETTSLIDDANIAAKRMEEANKEKKELLDREEILMAKRTLGGTTEAGQTATEKKETDEEYTARFQKGEADPLKDDGAK